MQRRRDALEAEARFEPLRAARSPPSSARWRSPTARPRDRRRWWCSRRPSRSCRRFAGTARPRSWPSSTCAGRGCAPGCSGASARSAAGRRASRRSPRSRARSPRRSGWSAASRRALRPARCAAVLRVAAANACSACRTRRSGAGAVPGAGSPISCDGAPGDEQRQHRVAAARKRDAQRLERAGLLVIALHADGERLEQVVERAIARIDVSAALARAGRSCRRRAPDR